MASRSDPTEHATENFVRGMAAPCHGHPLEAKVQQEAEQKAAQAAAEKERIKQGKREAKRAAKQARRSTDPQLLAYSRELRDRWQEAVAPGSEGAALLEDAGRGKYDVARLLAGPAAGGVTSGGEQPMERELIDAAVVKRLDDKRAA